MELLDGPVGERTLERFRYGVQVAISNSVLRDAKIDVSQQVRFFADELVMHVNDFLWGERAGVIERPADWWEAFKERWFPQWALKRWPARMTRYEAWALYPHYKPIAAAGKTAWKIVECAEVRLDARVCHVG